MWVFPLKLTENCNKEGMPEPHPSPTNHHNILYSSFLPSKFKRGSRWIISQLFLYYTFYKNPDISFIYLLNYIYIYIVTLYSTIHTGDLTSYTSYIPAISRPVASCSSWSNGRSQGAIELTSDHTDLHHTTRHRCPQQKGKLLIGSRCFFFRRWKWGLVAWLCSKCVFFSRCFHFFFPKFPSRAGFFGWQNQPRICFVRGPQLLKAKCILRKFGAGFSASDIFS